MVSGGAIEGIGDNLEFGIASAGTTVTIYFNGGASGTNTSADDTVTEKYSDTATGGIKQFHIRNDQAIEILGYNGLTFTDPISIAANKGHIERLDTPIVFKMVIRTTTANTNIKIRYRGRS